MEAQALNMPFEEIEKWIEDALTLGGNDFIPWNEVKDRVNGSTFLYD